MKNLLDKFSQSSLLVKFLFFLTLLLILATGMILSGPQDSKEEASRVIMRTGNTGTTSSTNVSSNDDQIRAEAEQAVKNLEDNQTEDNIQSAKDAVSKLKDEDIQQVLTARIQVVEDAIAARSQSSTPSANNTVSSSETVVIEDTPAVEVPIAPVTPTPVEPAADTSTSTDTLDDTTTTDTVDTSSNTSSNTADSDSK